jgi:transcriptional regulator with XRE-family HTH domain
MNYGDRLKRLREDKKLSQQQLADRLNINRSTYARYELAQTQPDYDTLKKIADFFQVSIDYLLGRTDNPSTVREEKTPYNAGKEKSIYDEQKELLLTPDELKVLQEIKKHPVLFHDLANAPEKKIKQLIKMWEFIKKDLESDDEEEGFGDIED